MVFFNMRRASLIEKILYAIAAVIGIALITGTVYALASGSRAKKNARMAVPAAAAHDGVYAELGRIRASTSDNPPAVVILNPAFPYNENDRQFREELRQKREAMRKAVIVFFASKKAAELQSEFENIIKASLRDTLNELLSLGKIEMLYFSEWSVIK